MRNAGAATGYSLTLGPCHMKWSDGLTWARRNRSESSVRKRRQKSALAEHRRGCPVLTGEVWREAGRRWFVEETARRELYREQFAELTGNYRVGIAGGIIPRYIDTLPRRVYAQASLLAVSEYLSKVSSFD